MCNRITCDVCGKPTWEGCGEHIEHALAGVAVADRCRHKAYVGTDTPQGDTKSGGGGASASSW